MRTRVVTAVTLLVVAAALGDRLSAQGGVQRIAFTWCYIDYGYSEGALVCRLVTMDPDAPVAFNPDGSDANWVSLTEGAGAAWSPDGTKIAFTGTHPFAAAGQGEVSVLNLADGTLTDPTDRLTWSYWIPSPTWSPDGSKIAFASDRDGPLELYVMNADGSGVTGSHTTSGFLGSPRGRPTAPESRAAAWWNPATRTSARSTATGRMSSG